MTNSSEREFYQLLKKYGPDDRDLVHIDPQMVGVKPNIDKLRQFEPTRKNFVILFGASAAGKDEIVKNLNPDDYTFMRSMTTRSPRPSDRPGSYRYVKRTEFEQLYAQGFFLEKTDFGAEHKNLYGTPKEDVQAAISTTKPVIAILDYHGVEAFLILQAHQEPIFQSLRLIACHITPPSLSELKRRLLSRDGNLHRWPMVENDLKAMGLAHYILDNDNLAHSLALVNHLANSPQIVGLGL